MAKKITSIALAMVLLITCSLGATTALAAESNDNTGQNETIVIDGSLYEFEDAYWNGMPATYINNLTENTRDVVYYDEATGTVYWNGTPIAYVEKVSTDEVTTSLSNAIPLANNDDYWTYHDTSTHTISWPEIKAFQIGVIVVGTAIAAALPGITAVQVISAVGIFALNEIADTCEGGTLTCVGYSHVLNDGTIQFRFDWSFTATTGKTYGPFSTYQL